MSPKISIIIPCYNCEKTLEEAVASCFTQNLENFEIVMVDDASTDNTREIIKKLLEKYKEIKVIYHDKNKGGGAARNTGINNSSGELIFCLDSDDILPEGTLGKMQNYREEKKCDGVAIHHSIKFNGKNIKDISRIDNFGYAGEQIPPESLLEKITGKLCPLYYVFMFTRKAFEISGGYPEDHGFDTQGFAWRFLAKNLVAFTCPETEYLHRVNFNKSYYIREYLNGRINYNWQKILEEFLYLFKEPIQKTILSFNIKNPTINILDEIQKTPVPFIATPFPITNNDIAINDQNPYSVYWAANEYLKKSDFTKALTLFIKIKASGLNYEIIDRKIAICEQALNTKVNYPEIEKDFYDKYLRKLNSPISICLRLFKKIFKR